MIHFDISTLKKDLNLLEEKTNSPDFWSNTNKSAPILSKIKELKNKIDLYTKLNSDLVHIENLNDLLMLEYDSELLEELTKYLIDIEKNVNKLEIATLFSGKYDRNNAILTLHPGAGGTESQDWVQMLYRMYSRWATANGYTIKELDYMEGEEAGIKSVTFLVSGEYSYGYLKGEMGVHRLVRISPFDSGGRRHTSFASLEVLPEITDDIKLEINPEDLRIDTYRASRCRRSTYKQNRFSSKNYSYTYKYCCILPI